MGFGLLILAVYNYWGQDAWRQAVYLYWQHRAMTHTLPADQVVYESDPVEAAKLIASGGGQYQLVRYHTKDGWPASGQQAAGYYSGFMPRLHGQQPKPEVGGLIFVHHRQTPDGKDRLLGVGSSLWQIDKASQALKLSGMGYARATSELRSRITSNTVQGKSPYPSSIRSAISSRTASGSSPANPIRTTRPDFTSATS